LPYGISAISLANTGATKLEGIRACVSLISKEDLPTLGPRLQQFHQDHHHIHRNHEIVKRSFNELSTSTKQG
ncbi:MAG: hypothetical protein HQK50_15075, partial [Oligoflexia bacterium]|nr:hypothetical protein [Oligoflexia bacterium]